MIKILAQGLLEDLDATLYTSRPEYFIPIIKFLERISIVKLVSYSQKYSLLILNVFNKF